MIILKNNYYLYIKNTSDLCIEKIKSNKKINIILRNTQYKDISNILKFRRKCKIKKFKLFIANNIIVAKKVKADGLYISSYNKKKYYINIPKIGSAHNLKEINEKKFQGCGVVIFSRLFKTKYKDKKNYIGVVKFNLLIKKKNKKIIPLGGINNQNLLKLNMINSEGFAYLSAVKKKPAISSRLF